MISEVLTTLGPPVLVRERAFEQIREAIITGRLAPGARLIERELCEALGISRASVREVIRRLEAERLVVVDPRRSPVVVRLTAEEASEIYEIRALLEGLIVRRFTERAGESDIAALEAIFADVRQAAARTAVARIVSLMQRFNGLLLEVAGHVAARDMLAHLDARISWLRVRAMAAPGRLAASIDEISVVIEAIRKREAAKAAALIQQSVLNARDAAIEQIVATDPAAQQPLSRPRLP